MKRTYANTTHGFTIVELLIVIVVIGILAAISIVAYNGVSNSAHDSTIKSDLANFAKATQLYHAEKGMYPETGQLGLLNLRVTKTSYDTVGYNLYYCTDAGINSKFGFAAKSKSGKIFYMTSAGSGEAGTASMNAVPACSPIGVSDSIGANLTYGYHRINASWYSWTD
ncbi:hypothetical protein B7Z17_01370 [Candidatus Saccharibacteria bacterium 32-49-10]|nr:MAG: hypothetical protein B7Z17_01370 [Candidatus Saccharibacteria bacterium 32-49-10]